MITLDAGTDEELSRGDLVKGYEFKKDHYVLIDDEDFEQRARSKVLDRANGREVRRRRRASTRSTTTPATTWPRTATAGQDVYVVLRDAIAKTGRVALSRVVIARRERAIAIMPMERGLVVHTLHERARPVRPEGAVRRACPRPSRIRTWWSSRRS